MSDQRKAGRPTRPTVYTCKYRKEGVECSKWNRNCKVCGWNPEVEKARKEKIINKMNGITEGPSESAVETNVFDLEEVHDNCTVIIWSNSTTGEKSWAWYDNDNPPLEIHREEEPS